MKQAVFEDVCIACCVQSAGTRAVGQVARLKAAINARAGIRGKVPKLPVYSVLPVGVPCKHLRCRQ